MLVLFVRLDPKINFIHKNKEYDVGNFITSIILFPDHISVFCQTFFLQNQYNQCQRSSTILYHRTVCKTSTITYPSDRDTYTWKIKTFTILHHYRTVCKTSTIPYPSDRDTYTWKIKTFTILHHYRTVCKTSIIPYPSDRDTYTWKMKTFTILYHYRTVCKTSTIPYPSGRDTYIYLEN